MIDTLAAVLAVASTAAHGLLAGLNVDRSVVQMPAWRRVGASGWADFSRHADLGPGRALYPAEGICSMLLAIGMSVAFHADAAVSPRARAAANVVVALSVLGILVTVKAAPFMLRLRKTDLDSAAVSEAFRGFHRWGSLRAVFQCLAFVLQLLTLFVLLTG